MDNRDVYLEKISAFSRILRMEGLPISPRDTEDACKILLSLGLTDRDQVKTALRTVYSKSREEQETFDRTFDGFFISEEAMRQQAKEQMEREQEIAKGREQARQDMNINGQPMDMSQEQQEVYATMPEEIREKLRGFMDRYKDSISRNPDLYSNFIHSVFTRTLLEQQIKMEDAAVGCHSMDPDIGLMYRDISQFREEEIPKAISIIEQISRQINSELSAKRKDRGRSAVLDFRRTIRKSLETGGSLYDLRYRRKRQRKKHLVILCDVSGSMVQFSEFALRFIQSLNQVSESSRVYLFSEDLVEADPFSLQNMDMFRKYVRDSGAYGRGTDLGTALERLVTARPAVLSDSTTLLILSDTKTVHHEKALQVLIEAKRLAGRVLIMNPIPESHWPYLKSAGMFASVCSMVSCATLNTLAAACRKLSDL